MAGDISVGNLVLGIKTKLDDFKRDMEEAKTTLGGVTTTINDNKGAFLLAGAAFAGVGTGIIGALGAAASESMEFNLEMANVSTMLGGSTTRTNELKDAIQDMSVEVGESTSVLADGAYQVISAFGDSADTVDRLEISAKAATAGVSTTTDALDLLSAVSKGYNDTSTGMLTNVSDLAFKTVELGQTTFPELAGSIGRVVPLANELGISQAELFTVMATGTGVTGKAAEVSTQFRGILQALLAPTEDMTALIEDQGFSSGKAMLAQLGLAGTLDLIKTASEESDKPLQKYIGSIEGQTLALALTGAQADTYTAKLEEMGNAAGSTERAFIAQTEGINEAGFSWNQLKLSMTGIVQEIGDSLQPAINVVTSAVLVMTENIRNFLQEHPNLTSVIVGFAAALGVVFLGIAGLIGVGLGFPALVAGIGAVITAAGFASAAFIGLGAALGVGTGGLTLIIAGVVAAIALIVTHWDELSAAIKTGYDTIIKPYINDMKIIFGYLWDKVEEVFDFIKDKIEDVFYWLGECFEDPLGNMKTGFTAVWYKVKEVFEWIWGKIDAVFFWIWEAFTPLIDLMKGGFTAVWDTVKQVFEWIWGKIDTVFYWITDIFTPLIDLMKGGFGAVWTTVQNIFNWIWNKINTVFQWIGDITEPLIDLMTGGFGSVWDTVEDVFDWVWDKAKTAIGNIYDSFRWLLDKLGIELPEIDDLWNTIKDTGEGAATAIDSKWDEMKKSYKGHMEETKQKYKEVEESKTEKTKEEENKRTDKVDAEEKDRTKKIGVQEEARTTKADREAEKKTEKVEDEAEKKRIAEEKEFQKMCDDADAAWAASKSGQLETHQSKRDEMSAYSKEKFGLELSDEEADWAIFLQATGADWETYIEDIYEDKMPTSFQLGLEAMQLKLNTAVMTGGVLWTGIQGFKDSLTDALGDAGEVISGNLASKLSGGVQGALSGMGTGIATLAGSIAGLGATALAGFIINKGITAFGADYEGRRIREELAGAREREYYTTAGIEEELKGSEWTWSEETWYRTYYALEELWAKKNRGEKLSSARNSGGKYGYVTEAGAFEALTENYWAMNQAMLSGFGYQILQQDLQDFIKEGEAAGRFGLGYKDWLAAKGYGTSLTFTDLQELGSRSLAYRALPHFQQGGYVEDTGLIYAHAGEGVLNQQTMESIGGAAALNRMNTEGIAPGITVNITGNHINSELDLKRLAKQAGEEIMKTLKYQVQFAR